MKNHAAVLFFIFFFASVEIYGEITLTAITHPGKASVTLHWNIVNYPGTTAYTLFKITDGIAWEITVVNPVFRNYTS